MQMLRVPDLLMASMLFASVAFGQGVTFPGMNFPGSVTRDVNGIPTIEALTQHDLFFLQGYTHAQDRFFQMDSFRKIAAGRFAEMVGPDALPTDVQLRTIGLLRSAELSHRALNPRTRVALEAYARGVNTWRSENPLPPEYGALELTQVEPWTALDSVSIAKLLTFQSSFNTSDIDRTVALLTYQGAGQAVGFNGQALFFEDLFRSQPFNPASTVPDARGTAAVSPAKTAGDLPVGHYSTDWINPRSVELAQEWLSGLQASPFFEKILNFDQAKGSNEWAVAGRVTTTGNAMMANDPHLELTAPSTFYPMALRAPGISATGHSFAGAPFIVHGQNQWVTWGSTINPMDVTDIYQEQIVPDAAAPAGLSVMYQGQREWLFPIVQMFRMNRVGSGTQNDVVVVPPGGAIPPATLIVTRRNAPIISLDAAAGTALSVQYTGLYATRELDSFYRMNEARNIEQFRDALQYFDVGSQNWVVADSTGSIGYFTSGEMPLRADLQAGAVVGLPPSFLRDGASGQNDWIRQIDVPENQATFAQILPFSEMPQVVNPAAGWFVNANNDPAGTTLDNNPFNQLRTGGGIYYLNYDYSGFRGGRITQMIRQMTADGRRISMADMKRIQADTVMIDAEFFTPHILAALDNARAPGAHPVLASFGNNPAIVAAVERLRGWDFSTPTGIAEGYDWTDVNGQRTPPTADEIQRSVAATIYSVWRGQMIANTVDGVLGAGNLPRPGPQQTMTALQNLFVTFATRQGHGASGVNFFNVPNVDNASVRRDIIVLKSLADSLALLSGDAFAPAFNRSTNLDDYRWGKLHRVVFAHRLGSIFNVPPAAGAFPQPLPGLPGIPTDGGFEVVDASSHNPRAASVNAFMFGDGPARRYVGEVTSTGIRGETSTPGGVSGVPGSPTYVNLLPMWLTNDYYAIQAAPAPMLPWRR
jgi:penicillin G amidase